LKNFVQLFENWLITEGGWATNKTQDTIIRPMIIADCVAKLSVLGADFNRHCQSESVKLPPLEFLKPVGSGSWYQDDIKSQPDKVYGDVDYMVSYPVLDLEGKNDRANEIATVKLYNAELMSFIKSQNYSFLDIEESVKISQPDSIKLIMNVKVGEGEGWIQVDMIVTHSGYKDWAIFRMTPIRNVKGFVLGNLYSSFGEVLDLSIQPRGVRVKFSGSQMVAYSKRAATEERLLTSNITTFMHDIAQFFWEQSGTDKPYKESQSLEIWRGIDPKSPTFEDLCDGVRAVAETLEQLGEFGTVIKYKNAKELIDAVKAQYIQKMTAAAAAEKFNKATTPAAFAAAEKVRKLVEEYIEKANKLL